MTCLQQGLGNRHDRRHPLHKPLGTMFETKSQPLLAKRHFYRRLAASGIVALAVTFVSLIMGMAGYHWIEGLGWMDAYINAAMLLGGMGPLEQPHTSAGKF